MENSNSQSVGADDTLLPDWLDPAPPRPSPEGKALVLVQYEQVFMRAIDSIAHGKSLSQVLRDDQRDIDYNDFYRWIKKDPTRKSLFDEAQELRTEFMAGEIIEIADADDSLEDVNRSKLKIDTRKWLMGAHNKKKYGATTSIEMTGGISITGALAAAQARVIDAEVIDITDLAPRLDN